MMVSFQRSSQTLTGISVSSSWFLLYISFHKNYSASKRCSHSLQIDNAFKGKTGRRAKGEANAMILLNKSCTARQEWRRRRWWWWYSLSNPSKDQREPFFTDKNNCILPDILVTDKTLDDSVKTSLPLNHHHRCVLCVSVASLINGCSTKGKENSESFAINKYLSHSVSSQDPDSRVIESERKSRICVLSCVCL